LPPKPGIAQAPGCRKAAFFVALFVIVPVLISVVVAVVGLVKHNDEPDTPGSEPSSSSSADLGGVPVPAPKRPTPRLAPGATSVRFEFNGRGHTPDITIYRDESSTTTDATTLPYAVTVPVNGSSTFLSGRATDFGSRDASSATPMECRAYVGNVLVALNVGTDRVECQVTKASFPSE
jgi:hypothetical protein